MGRRIKHKRNKLKRLKRAKDYESRKSRRQKKLIDMAKQYVINLANIPLSNTQYLTLAKGLKFIPNPPRSNKHKQLLQSFDEFARKIRCRFHYCSNDNPIHPFRIKSGYKPHYTCFELENYLDITKLDISHMEICEEKRWFNYDDLRTLKSLRNLENIIFSKTDKSGSICIIKKEHYIREGLRQLQTEYYTEINKPNLNLIQDQLNVIINGMLERKEIDETTLAFLRESLKSEPRMGKLFLLPKVHKYDTNTFESIMNGSLEVNELCPCRPIISQIGSITERVSKFIDYFLLPIVKRQNTYIRDSTDLINKIETISHPEDCLLATFDITSMYTNMHFNELISAVQNIWHTIDRNDYTCPIPSKGTISNLLRFVLENNYFTFNNKIYKQEIGASMGSKCSPSVCDVRAFQLIQEIVDKFETKNKMIFVGTFRDDGAITYSGTETELHEFFRIANSIHPLLKFTYNISSTEVVFLDTIMYKGPRFHTSGILDFRSYTKPTNTFQYLHRSSLHNPAVFAGFIKGETLRHIRNNNNDDTLINELSKFRLNLLKRGYKQTEVDKNIRLALSNKRSEVLKTSRYNKNHQIPLVFITKYHHSIRKIGFYLRKNWHKLKRDQICAKLFNNTPIVAYSRHKNISDRIVNSKI